MAENCPKDILSALGGPLAFDENSVGYKAMLFNIACAQVRSAAFNPLKWFSFTNFARDFKRVAPKTE